METRPPTIASWRLMVSIACCQLSASPNLQMLTVLSASAASKGGSRAGLYIVVPRPGIMMLKRVSIFFGATTCFRIELEGTQLRQGTLSADSTSPASMLLDRKPKIDADDGANSGPLRIRRVVLIVGIRTRKYC